MSINNDANISFRSAVYEGNFDRVNKLIDSIDLSSQDWEGGYVLLVDAMNKNYTDIAKLLLLKHCEVNNKSQISFNTPLHFAVINGNIRMVQILLDRDANINAKNEDGLVPLHLSLENNKIEISKLLLKRGANVDVQDDKGRVPLHVAALKNNSTIVKLLLSRKACVNSTTFLINENYHYGNNPLHYAVRNGNQEIVKLLLQTNICVNSREMNGSTPLHIAVEGGYVQIVKDLLNHGSDINAVKKSKWKEGYAALHFASEKGNYALVELLICKGANINATTKDNLTPLYIAVRETHEAIIKLLLERAYVDAQDKEGKTMKRILENQPDKNKNKRICLNTAVLSSEESSGEIVEHLLKYGFTVSPEDVNNCKLLQNAVMKGCLQIIEDLLNYGANVNMVEHTMGYTLLHIATINNHVEIVKLLIRREADVNAKDFYEQSPIYHAIYNANLVITNLLFENGAKANDYYDILNIAVNTDCIEIVQTLLEHDVDIDINARDEDEKTALHYIAISENESDTFAGGEIAKLILSKGANVNESTEGGTVLHVAVQNNKVTVVEALLEYNADVNSIDSCGMTPLHLAAQKGNEKICKMLLQKGAEINAKQKYERSEVDHSEVDHNNLARFDIFISRDKTPLQIAAQEGYYKVVELLLKFGSDVNYKDECGRIALHMAAKAGHNDIVELLLKFFADIDSKDMFKKTALILAATVPYKEVVDILVKHGADMESKDECDRTALSWAAYYGYKHNVEILLESGADINSKDEDGRSVLSWTDQEYFKDVFEILIKFGVDVDSKDARGWTALHHAVQRGSDISIESLLICGADIDSKNNCGETPLHRAFKLEHAICIIVLLKHYANINIIDLKNCLPVESEDNYNNRNIKEIFSKHLVKLQAANYYVHERNLQLLISTDQLNQFQVECENEIRNMRSEKIGYNNIYFYDILKKGLNQLAIYTKNRNFVQSLEFINYNAKFPIYANLIGNRFKKGQKRAILLDSIKSYLESNKFNFLSAFPVLVINEIFSNLSNTDMEIFIKELLSTSSGQ